MATASWRPGTMLAQNLAHRATLDRHTKFVAAAAMLADLAVQDTSAAPSPASSHLAVAAGAQTPLRFYLFGVTYLPIIASRRYAWSMSSEPRAALHAAPSMSSAPNGRRPRGSYARLCGASLAGAAIVGLFACNARPGEPSIAVAEPEKLLEVLTPSCELRDERAAWIAAGYRFELDGEPFLPALRALSGEPGAPREGDVIMVLDMKMILGPPGIYRYFTNSSEAWSLELEIDEGPRQLARSCLFDGELAHFPPGKSPFRNLRGLLFDGREGLPPRLDATRMFIHLDLDFLGRTSGSLPTLLPRTLRALRLDMHASGDGAQNAVELAQWLAALANYPQLRHLEIEIHQDSMLRQRLEVDAESLGKLSQLQRLELRGYATKLLVRGPERLSALKELRALELVQVEPIDLSFIGTLPELRSLVVERARTTDLRPLSAHPRLANLYIDSQAVSALPEPLPPSLREFTLLSPELQPEQLAALRTRAPGARIRGGWNQTRGEEVACATRIRILPECSCSHCPCLECPCPGCICESQVSKAAIELVDPAVISELLPLLAVEGEGDEVIAHGGSTTIEFYRGDVLITRVELDIPEMHGAPHHLPLIRWSAGGRPMSHGLSEPSRNALCAWFARHHVTDVCTRKAALE